MSLDDASPLLAVSGLTIEINDKLVVDDLSFAVAEGETIAIVGESGSGKTLATRSLLGLLPSGVNCRVGSMRFKGNDYRLDDLEALKTLRGHSLGMIFQEPMTSLNPALRIGQQLHEGLKLHTRLERAERERRILAMLERVGLARDRALLECYPHEFSGGMRQRIMIASVMLMAPALIVADEPTTALDAVVQREVMETMLALTREAGNATILISHDLAMVAHYASRVLVMCQGKLVEQGETVALLAAPRHPYTRKLLDALPRRVALAPPAPAEHPVLALQRAVIEYAGRRRWFRPTVSKRAVDCVSLEVARGETVALVGASGSGKTTVAKAIVGLVPLHSGEMCFDGRSLAGMDRSRRRTWRLDCQMIQQDPFSSLDPRMRVRQIVDEPLRLDAALDRGQRLARVNEVIDEVGLGVEFLERFPHQLSGGQRQRVAIARAIARKPRFIVADEPTSALDMTVQKQILTLLVELQRRYGFACLLITHDLGVVEQIAHRVLVMEQGRIVESGERDQVLDAPRHAYTRRLLMSLPQLAARAEGGFVLRERTLAGEGGAPT
ncbi:dipeptide ABC transporter ATP-binding protein [Billgrantia endophytica]|uniref:Peptide ABC transporter ATP-binding protein n=1 Tax=Billgrantia endophytica TaxID=2033802 RepID=A0A2N7U6Z3_9GAMM|nr:ABC transporter ATP-binding protein [Halomonas endophytica]PMR76204.1 peptide ABC transporter ATP-binding protein [Halomonas endophytica]